MPKPFIIQATGARGTMLDIITYLLHEALHDLTQNDDGNVAPWYSMLEE